MSKTAQSDPAVQEVKLITLDPGHFHAALAQKRMYPGVAKRVDIYAPLGFDLTEHLNRIARFNLRRDDHPVRQAEDHNRPNFFDRSVSERPGSALFMSGRTQRKIDRVKP